MNNDVENLLLELMILFVTASTSKNIRNIDNKREQSAYHIIFTIELIQSSIEYITIVINDVFLLLCYAINSSLATELTFLLDSIITISNIKAYNIYAYIIQITCSFVRFHGIETLALEA